MLNFNRMYNRTNFISTIRVLNLRSTLTTRRNTLHSLTNIMNSTNRQFVHQDSANQIINPSVPLSSFARRVIFLRRIDNQDRDRDRGYFSLLSDQCTVLRIKYDIL